MIGKLMDVVGVFVDQKKKDNAAVVYVTECTSRQGCSGKIRGVRCMAFIAKEGDRKYVSWNSFFRSKEGMELFQELRHLYVNVRNDVALLQETASRSTGTGLSRLQADKLFNEPHSDVRLLEEKVRAKIKEVQDETHFSEVVTCCFDVVNHSLTQLDQLEHHLQKYSVQPIGNARQRCESQSSVTSKENELPSAICNPISTAVPMVTEPCQPQVKEWPRTYDMPPTPKASDFGILESVTQRLDELTAAILRRSQASHAIVGQGQTEDGVLNLAPNPCTAQPSCHSSPTGADMASSSQNLKLDISDILAHDQNQAVPFPLPGTSLSHTDVRLSGDEAASGHLEFSSNTKSTLKVLDLPIPSPPQLSDLAKQALDFHVVAKDKVSVLSHSVKKELDLSPSLSTSLLSEQTVNILRQLQMSKISTSGVKLDPYSTKKIGENVPPDHPSTWKHSAVNTGHTTAKRCLDLGGGEQKQGTSSGHIYRQNVASTTEFMPKGTRTAASAAVTDQVSNMQRSSVKIHPCVTKTSSVLGHGDETSIICKTEKSSGSGFGSEDWTCPQIQHFSLDDYEHLVPAAVKNIVTLERVNDGIGKANDVLLNKMLDGSSMTLSVEDLKHAVGGKASLFLKLMSKTGRLLEKTGERGIAEYYVV